MLDIGQSVFMGADGLPTQAELIAYQKSASRNKTGLYCAFWLYCCLTALFTAMLLFSLWRSGIKFPFGLALFSAAAAGTYFGARGLQWDIKYLKDLKDFIDHPDAYDIREGVLGPLGIHISSGAAAGSSARAKWSMGTVTGISPHLCTEILFLARASAHSTVFIAVHKQHLRPPFFVGIKKTKDALDFDDIDAVMTEVKKRMNEKIKKTLPCQFNP
jgi:hypothetical protein